MKSRQQDTVVKQVDSSHGSIIPFPRRDPALEATLKRYEKRLIRSGKSRAEAKRFVERLAGVVQALVAESPWEREIRRALEGDRKAKRNLQFFASQGHPIQARITQLTMWAHAGLWSATLSVLDESTQRFIPRDRVLKLLRERGEEGATKAELARLGPRNYVDELRRERLNIEAIKETDGSWRYVLRGEGRKRPRSLVTQWQEYANVATAIENLGKPSQLIEAWRFSSEMTRLLRHHQSYPETSPIFKESRATLEADFLGFAGKHLKRWTYLMAVAHTVARPLERETIPGRAQKLFEAFHKRLTRSRHPKK